MGKGKKGGKQKTEVTREYTIHLHKHCHKMTFKKKAPRAVKVIKDFARKVMGTSTVKIDSALNKHIWSKGIRNIPRRVRVRINRKLNEDEDREEDYITVVTHVDVPANYRASPKRITEDDEE